MKKGTIRRRDRTDGTCRWYLDLGTKPWIEATTANGAPRNFNRPEDREAVDTWRDAFVATMGKLGATEQKTSNGVRPGTVADWFDRYYRAAAKGLVGRKNRGAPQAAVERRRAAFDTHLANLIGHLPMRDGGVTQAHMRKVVSYLDEQTRIRAAFYRGERHRDDVTGKKPGMSEANAKHVWGECTNGFREACASKRDELRVMTINPTTGVLPPDGGGDREQAALYPSEVTALLSSAIRASRRICYTVAIYTGMRRSELERLTAADVDLEHNMIRVRGKKSDAARRRVPIEPALRPLIERLCRAYPEGPLLDTPRADGKGGAADQIRKDIRKAGLTRPDLFLDTAHAMPFTFHGLRHTAVTHAYVAGRDETWLRIVYGHTMSEMTRRYLDGAALGRSTFGTPFPTLPIDLVESVPNHPVTDDSGYLDRHMTGMVTDAALTAASFGDPSGNRTRVTGVRGRCPNR